MAVFEMENSGEMGSHKSELGEGDVMVSGLV